MEYSYYVSSDTDNPGNDESYRKLYDGTDAAGAMAAWSQAVTEGCTYVVLEALRTDKP